MQDTALKYVIWYVRLSLQASQVFSSAVKIKSTRTCPVVEHLTACIGSEEVKTVKDGQEGGTENDTSFELL